MNSNKILLACISVGIVISISMGSRPSEPLGTVPTVSYGEKKKPETIQVLTTKTITVPRYRTVISVESTPETQSFLVEKSGYQQYTVRPTSEGYSFGYYEVISEKPLTTEEAYSYLKKYPEKCRKLSPEELGDIYVNGLIGGNIYDHYEAMREDYLSDPEDNINYPDDIFDFLDD